ncbi:MAG: SDR family oxidoreductase [Planctomycetota bacterium]|jgi:3-oxoacyl-[acyl-carrier protein] reductase|nr:SDR family oxidoreductase [Planctomycetota bacterium]
MSARPLSGKVAVVTGGSKGIGAAGVKAFAAAGASVVIGARGRELAEKTAGEIGAAGGKALAVACDVADYASVEGMFSAAAEAFGGVDLVLAGAGVNLQRDLLVDADIDLWRKTIEINLIGVYHTARAAIPRLKARGGGKFIAIGSGRGRRGSTHSSAYACSKAGQWMLIRCLAEELLDSNIAVNEIVPGPVWTDMNTQWGDRIDPIFTGGPEWAKQPDDVVPLLMFLATQPNLGPTGQFFALNRREI